MATTLWLCATSAAAVHDGAATAITIAEIRHRWRARRSLLIALVSLLRAAPNTCATKDMLADLSRHQGSRRQGQHYHRSRPRRILALPTPSTCSPSTPPSPSSIRLTRTSSISAAGAVRQTRCRQALRAIPFARVGTTTVAVVLGGDGGGCTVRRKKKRRCGWLAHEGGALGGVGGGCAARLK